MQLAVLNPGGRDPEQAFRDFAGEPDDRVHAPVNYHAYAACTGGAFYENAAAISAAQRHVLLLIRRDLRECLDALRELKAAGKIVAVSLKESGAAQFAHAFADALRMELFREICALAGAALSSTPDLVPIYQTAGAQVAEFIPTPYPVDDARWDFSEPIAPRRGVFIGTRELDVSSRHHLAAVLAAMELRAPITVINRDGRAGRRPLEMLGCKSLNIVEGPLPYTAYLKLMARHRLVFQLDRSAVPGQVAGDALLCRIPCVGGDGAIERIVFPDSHGHGPSRGSAALMPITAKLLADDAAYAQAIENSQRLAREQVSFSAIRARLEDFFQRLERTERA